jgi:hypothetical protein
MIRHPFFTDRKSQLINCSIFKWLKVYSLFFLFSYLIRTLKTGLLLFMGILLTIFGAGGCHHSNEKPKGSAPDIPVQVEPMLISRLGPEHFGNAVYRRGMDGPCIAASGARILEWPIQVSAPTREVFKPDSGNYQNGACAMDVNGDNIDEMIVAKSSGDQKTELLWYEEITGQKQWQEHFIASISRRKGEEGLHDIMPFSMRYQDKLMQGAVIVVNRKILYWFEIPTDPTQPWDRHLIADLSKDGAECAQSGLVLGDITGNGRQDLVCGNFWAECPADPVKDPWQIHRYSNWDRRKTPIFPDVPAWVGDVRFGGMNQLDLGDMDGDGMLDIVATDAEIPDARVGIFCRDSGNLWKEYLVDTALYCPHSLVVADVNKDNRPDIIVGEMTAGGWWFPRNPDPRLYLYLNEGHLNFRKFILHKGWGTHMMRMAPETRDDKIFVFADDEIQSWYPDMITRVVGWRLGPKE